MGTGCPEMRATTVGTAWAWRAWATSRGGVDVDARYLETSGVLPGELLQEGGQLGTGLAARTVEDDDDGDLGGDLGDVTQAGGVDVDHQRHRQAATCTSGSTGRGSRGASGRAGRLGGGGETGQVDGAEHAHEQLPSSGRSPVASLVWVIRCLGAPARRTGPATGLRPERASGPAPSDHGAGPGTGGAQDGLAVADAVGAGVLESSRSTFISAVSAPRTATLSLLPSLGMEKAPWSRRWRSRCRRSSGCHP